MARSPPFWNRREILGGLGAASFFHGPPGLAQTPINRSLRLQATTKHLALRKGAAPTEIWSIKSAETPDGPADTLRVPVNAAIRVNMGNALPSAIALHWTGVGNTAIEPLLGRPLLAQKASENFDFIYRYAGIFTCDMRLMEATSNRPSALLPVIVEDPAEEAWSADRDKVFLVEDWRLRPDGSGLSPPTDLSGNESIFTVNGQLVPDILGRQFDRLRLRFINGCQRSVVAIKIENIDLRVMALDGLPAEPFPARNGALVLAPGSRADTLIDMTANAGSSATILLHDGKEARPIARLVTSNERPVRNAALPLASALSSARGPAAPDLKNARRLELLPLNSWESWMPATGFKPAKSAFRVRAGDTVVLALANKGLQPVTFHPHGHHFRLLDRLDDGWKPFWLERLAMAPGEAQRIAFVAEHPGRWLIEAIEADWRSPRLLSWYEVG